MQKNTRYNKDKDYSHVDTKSFLIAYLPECGISTENNSIGMSSLINHAQTKVKIIGRTDSTKRCAPRYQNIEIMNTGHRLA